jgi:hypothetical protein
VDLGRDTQNLAGDLDRIGTRSERYIGCAGILKRCMGYIEFRSNSNRAPLHVFPLAYIEEIPS